VDKAGKGGKFIILVACDYWFRPYGELLSLYSLRSPFGPPAAVTPLRSGAIARVVTRGHPYLGGPGHRSSFGIHAKCPFATASPLGLLTGLGLRVA